MANVIVFGVQGDTQLYIADLAMGTVVPLSIPSGGSLGIADQLRNGGATVIRGVNLAIAIGDIDAEIAALASGKADAISGKADAVSGKASIPVGASGIAAGKADVASGKADPASGKADPASGKADPASGKADPASRKADPAAGKADS
jgi:hypothetical protein